jgi:predicted transcriptional regulator
MSDKPGLDLGRRERQIMEILYRRGRASVSEVLADLPDPPSYSAVRAMLRHLEKKGHVRHVREGRKFLFMPVVAREMARKSALRNLIQTFFGGSVEQTVASMLDLHRKDLSEEELDRLARKIDEARKEGR